MTAADFNATAATPTDSTLGPRFGWSLSYDPQIKTGQAPDQQITKIDQQLKVRQVADGKAYVEYPDGHTDWIPIATVSKSDVNDKGKKSTWYFIDPKAPNVQKVTDGDGHTYQVINSASHTETKTGDVQHQSASQLMSSYALKAQSSNAQDRQQFLDLQNQLEAAGLLPKGKYIKGLPDDPTEQALQSALVLADRTGQTLDEVLDQAKGAAKTTTAKPPRLTNPQDIAANAQKAGYQTLGKPVDPGTIATLQQRAEDQAQAQYTDSDGNIQYSSFSPSEAWLEQQLQDLMPQTAKAYGEFQGIGATQQLLGTASSPVGNLYHE